MKNQILLFATKTAFCLFWISVCMLNSKDFMQTKGWLATAIICGAYLCYFYFLNYLWRGEKDDAR